MIAERANPGNAQLRGRDTLASRYTGQGIHKLAVILNGLWEWVVSAGEPKSKRVAYLILEATEHSPKVAFRQVLLVLDLAGE